MYNYREYFITVTAIFLSLAFGILVGISFGEDYLVSNQREIIELMEQELGRQQKMITLQESDLQQWEKLMPLIRRAYQETLAGKNIVVLTFTGEKVDHDLEMLLRGAGAETTLINIPAGEYTAMPGELNSKIEALVQILTGNELYPADEITGADGWLPSAGEAGGWPPDRYLIPFTGNGPPESQIMEELWSRLHQSGTGVIGILFSWQDSRALNLNLPEEGISMVDNIDTIWGQVSLLEMLVNDLTGHYGFGSDGGRLLPPLERVEND